MLLEDSQPQQPEREKKPLPPGVHRLQPYTAEPDPVAAPESKAGAPSQQQQQQQLSALGEAYAHPKAPIPGYGPEYAAIFSTGLPENEQPKDTADPVHYKAREVDHLSWAEYLDLDKRERGAVDFNTLLVQARQKDLNRQDDYHKTGIQRTAYDNTVKKMFGEDGGSQTYAPETVALLSDIGFKETDAKRFDDLDKFLGLKSALTADDIESIGRLHPDNMLTGQPTVHDRSQGLANFSSAGPMDLTLGGIAEGKTLPRETNQDAATVLAAGTHDLTEALTRGNQVLNNFRQVAAGARNETLLNFGGIENRFASPDIRLRPEDRAYFDQVYMTLASAATDPAAAKTLRDAMDPDQYHRFVQYADTKSRYSRDNGVQLGADKQVTYRTPEQLRQLLGLEGGESGAPVQ